MNNLLGSYGIKILLSLVPFLIVTIYVVYNKNKTIQEEQFINRKYNQLNKTLNEKNVSQFLKNEKKKTFLDIINSKLNILGIESKFENIAIYSLILFIGSALFSKLLIGAGWLLMLYFGVLFLL